MLDDWAPDPTQHDLFMFTRGYAANGGHVYGDLYDFRVYSEKLINSTDVSRMWTNKLTIANIPFGQVIVSNYWATYDLTANLGYTSIGYTSAGYTQ